MNEMICTFQPNVEIGPLKLFIFARGFKCSADTEEASRLPPALLFTSVKRKKVIRGHLLTVTGPDEQFKGDS